MKEYKEIKMESVCKSLCRVKCDFCGKESDVNEECIGFWEYGGSFLNVEIKSCSIVKKTSETNGVEHDDFDCTVVDICPGCLLTICRTLAEKLGI